MVCFIYSRELIWKRVSLNWNILRGKGNFFAFKTSINHNSSQSWSCKVSNYLLVYYVSVPRIALWFWSRIKAIWSKNFLPTYRLCKLALILSKRTLSLWSKLILWNHSLKQNIFRVKSSSVKAVKSRQYYKTTLQQPTFWSYQ